MSYGHHNEVITLLLQLYFFHETETNQKLIYLYINLKKTLHTVKFYVFLSASLSL